MSSVLLYYSCVAHGRRSNAGPSLKAAGAGALGSAVAVPAVRSPNGVRCMKGMSPRFEPLICSASGRGRVAGEALSAAMPMPMARRCASPEERPRGVDEGVRSSTGARASRSGVARFDGIGTGTCCAGAGGSSVPVSVAASTCAAGTANSRARARLAAASSSVSTLPTSATRSFTFDSASSRSGSKRRSAAASAESACFSASSRALSARASASAASAFARCAFRSASDC